MATEIKSPSPIPSDPPHVAIGAQSNDHSALLAGVPAKRFFTDAGVFVRVQRWVTEYYGFDVVSNFWDVYNIEAEALGQKILYPTQGIPDVDRSRPLIATPSDLDRIHAPNPRRSGRMPWVLEINRRLLESTGSVDRVYFSAPFSIAANIRGYENLIDDMYDRPAYVHRLFRFLCDEVICPFVDAMRTDIGAQDLMIDGRDAWASPPMITLDMMDEYVVSYTERLRRQLGGRLVSRGNWGDAHSGDIERFFSQKLACSPGVLSVLDPDLFAVTPERVNRFARAHGAAVTAGVDATLLKNGPVQAIAERIRLYIDRLARDGQCMIHLNQIPADTPAGHVHAAVAACHTYGRFPIAEELDKIAFEPSGRESFADFLSFRRRSGPFPAGR